MYVHVFYFHEEKRQVVRSYIGSHFFGHANSEEAFQSTIEKGHQVAFLL